MLNRFVYLADDDSDSRVLPMAATLERQRVELLDEYERRLMLRQMQNSYVRQQPVYARQHLYIYLDASRQMSIIDYNLSIDYSQTIDWHNSKVSLALYLLVDYSELTDVDEAVVQQLIDMGFNDRDAIRWALVQCHNDVSQATNFLLQQRS